MSEERQRIDKWLFFARMAKSRSLAAKLAQAGRVRVNGDKIGQASHTVKAGDTLTITFDRRIRILRILDTGSRRGPFEEARLLYDDLSPVVEKAKPDFSTLPAMRDAGAGRPTKRDRRRLEKWNFPDGD